MFWSSSALIIVALVTSLVGFSGGGLLAWNWQENKYESKIAKISSEAHQRALQIEQNYASQQRKSEASSALRQSKLRYDLDAARAESDRLRDSLSRNIDLSKSSPASCPDRTAAIADILREMEAEGRAVSEAADRHVESVKILLERWPSK